MAVPTRARRVWTDLEIDIRRRLKETTASYWTQAALLQLTNERMDLRVMHMALASEGWVTDTFKTDVVADQREYSLPESAGRLKNVLWSVTDPGSSSGTRETPMNRNEAWYTSSGRTTTGFGYSAVVPEYRLEGNLIIIEPTPDVARTNGLWIQCEYTPARLTTGAKLDLRFPGELETQLILDVVVEAFRIEASRTNEEPAGMADAVRARDEYAGAWLGFIEERSSGTVTSTAYYLGD